MRKTARPAEASDLRMSAMTRMFSPSSPLVGSSSTRIEGDFAMAQPMTRRCFSPPERLCGCREAFLLALRLGKAGGSDGRRDFLAHRAHLQLMVGVLKHEPRPRHEAARRETVAVDFKAPFCAMKTGQDPRERRLARAVRSDERGDPFGDGEADAFKDGIGVGVREPKRFNPQAFRSAALKRLAEGAHFNVGKGAPNVVDARKPQAVTAPERFVPQHLEGASSGDAAFRHDEDFVDDVLEPVQTVVDDENRRTAALQFTDRAGERFGRLRVEVGARFVEHERLRSEREDGGKSNFLLLSLGKREDALAEKRGDAERFCRTLDPRSDFFAGQPAALKSEGDFVADVQGEELFFGILKERPDVFGKKRYGRLGGVEPVDRDLSLETAAENLRSKPVRQPHDRRLAAARGARDELDFARGDRKRDVPKRGGFGVRVGVGDVLKFDAVQGGFSGLRHEGCVAREERAQVKFGEDDEKA